jgi:hypothetical protein
MSIFGASTSTVSATGSVGVVSTITSSSGIISAVGSWIGVSWGASVVFSFTNFLNSLTSLSEPSLCI